MNITERMTFNHYQYVFKFPMIYFLNIPELLLH